MSTIRKTRQCFAGDQNDAGFCLDTKRPAAVVASQLLLATSMVIDTAFLAGVVSRTGIASRTGVGTGLEGCPISSEGARHPTHLFTIVEWL